VIGSDRAETQAATIGIKERSVEGRQRSSLFTILVGVAVLIMVAIIGYLIIDTMLSVRDSLLEGPGLIGERIDQIANPTPTVVVDPVAVVLEIRALSRLETASYTIERIITAESGEGPLGFLFRDRLLLVAHGQVIAGVDLGRLSEDDIRVAGDRVFVTLPAAEVFVATLNNERTYVYERDTAIFGQQVDLETLARQAAEEAILEAALEDGILEQAQTNAENYVRVLLLGLGFEDVVFVPPQATPEPTP
jgi:hypothetical protein